LHRRTEDSPRISIRGEALGTVLGHYYVRVKDDSDNMLTAPMVQIPDTIFFVQMCLTMLGQAI
jgi:hypothetical protein